MSDEGKKARLISKAPEMAELLLELRDCLETMRRLDALLAELEREP